MADVMVSIDDDKSRFYETKKGIEMLLSDHLKISKTLLSQVNSNNVDSFKYQRKHVKMSSTSDGDVAMIDGYYSYTENFNKPKCIKQSEWLLKASHVMCNLSSVNGDVNTNIPDILMTNPVDLLCGNTDNIKNNDNNEDKLSKLLNGSGHDDLKAELNMGNGSSELSFDILSTHDFNKTSDDFNKLITTACKNLQTLGDLKKCGANVGLAGNYGDKISNIEKSVHDLPIDVQDYTRKFLYNNNPMSSKLDELSRLEFEYDSGFNFNDQTAILTNTLLHINEKDKSKEVELAPKITSTATNDKKTAEYDVQSRKFNKTNYSSSLEGFETDLLGNFTIIRDEKLGRKMYRLSDFNVNYTKVKNNQSTSVEVQTDNLQVASGVREDKKPHKRSNVEVVQMSEAIINNSSNARKTQDKVTKEDLYVKKIMALHEKRVNRQGSIAGILKDGQSLREKKRVHFQELVEKEEYEYGKWRNLRKPIYDKIMTNRYTSDRYAANIKPKIEPREMNIVIPTEVYYEEGERGTNEKSNTGRYYGYDELNNIVLEKEKMFDDLKSNKVTDTLVTTKNIAEVKSRNVLFNPILNFDQWWNNNTLNSSRIKNELII